MWDVKFYFFLKNPGPFGPRLLVAWSLLLGAYFFLLILGKTFHSWPRMTPAAVRAAS
jgi:RsiW-degrading membrane proteinase PrsW (M82 family)